MRYHLTKVGLAAMLIALAGCHSSPSGPSFPQETPVPAWSGPCTGHMHYEGEAGPVYDCPTQSAYWTEATDSSSASLQVSMECPAYHDTVEYDTLMADTLFLIRNDSGWNLAPNDRRFASDTFQGVFKYVTPVTITTDSVTIGLYRLFSWTTYYLKKL